MYKYQPVRPLKHLKITTEFETRPLGVGGSMEDRRRRGMDEASYSLCYLILVYPVSGNKPCALSFTNGVPFLFVYVPVRWR